MLCEVTAAEGFLRLETDAVGAVGRLPDIDCCILHIEPFNGPEPGARAGALPTGTAAAFSLSQQDTALLVPFS